MIKNEFGLLMALLSTVESRGGRGGGGGSSRGSSWGSSKGLSLGSNKGISWSSWLSWGSSKSSSYPGAPGTGLFDCLFGHPQCKKKSKTGWSGNKPTSWGSNTYSNKQYYGGGTSWSKSSKIAPLSSMTANPSFASKPFKKKSALSTMKKTAMLAGGAYLTYKETISNNNFRLSQFRGGSVTNLKCFSSDF